MIVDFTVSNYRSIKEPITLSFIAKKGRKTKNSNGFVAPPDEITCPGIEVENRDFKLLPVAAIFGPNASGKTNVVRALGDFISLVNGHYDSKNSFRNFIPFKLDRLSAHSPTTFELRTVFKGVIFVLSLSLQTNKILHEKLEYLPVTGRRQSSRLLYERKLEPHTDTYTYKTGEDFAGPHVQLMKSTKSHEIYFGLLHRLEIEVTRNLMRWLSRSQSGIYCGDEDLFEKLSMEWSLDFIDEHKINVELIKLFDVGLEDILIEEDQLWAIHTLPENMTEVRWEFTEESLGTRRLFGLLPSLRAALVLGTPLVIDEFGSNFHPKITRMLIHIFQNPSVNKIGGQLIFTSHDNTLWRGVLRRDEIWLAEKGAEHSTKLISLSDFKPRNDLALDKAYLDGRFGGIPLVGDIEESLKETTHAA